MDESPIFIVGVGRSGTSLLQCMLAAHPGLAFPPETAFLRRYVSRGLLAKTFRRSGVSGVRETLEGDSMLRRLPVSAADLADDLIERSETSDLDARLYAGFLRAVAARKGAGRCGDKDPRAVEFLAVLHHYWPKAHVVHIIRDPRDVLASKKKARWSRGRAALTHIFANRVQLEMGRSQGARLFGPRYHEIVYEDLISVPEAVLKRLCRGLDLDYSDRMLSFQDGARALVKEDELDWKKETLGPLLPDNKGKWRGSLSPFELAATERICREGLGVSTGGNDLPRTPVGPASRALALVFGAAVRPLAWLYRRYRVLTIRRLLPKDSTA